MRRFVFLICFGCVVWEFFDIPPDKRENLSIDLKYFIQFCSIHGNFAPSKNMTMYNFMIKTFSIFFFSFNNFHEIFWNNLFSYFRYFPCTSQTKTVLASNENISPTTIKLQINTKLPPIYHPPGFICYYYTSH